MKILFIEPYPTHGASSRYRVEQLLPYLRDKGIRCVVRPFVSEGFYKILYKKGSYLRKALFFSASCLRRFIDILAALSFDIIFVHLESFPIGPPFLEWIFAKLLGKKIVYDLDDAIYMGATSTANKFLKYLKQPSKIKRIIKLSKHVITCNKYLADYARQYNQQVTAIHTSIDTEKFVPRHNQVNNGITIGWIGSHSTAQYLEALKNIFFQLSRKYRFNLKIIGAGGYNLNIPGLKIINMDWRLEDEIEQFQSLDIGVYPLPDDKWILGKTGFKTIQYMSVGIPCVVSNVGTNRDIVQNGVNGFLAQTEEEWVRILSKLIEDADLRRRIGEAGRRTVEEKFSLKTNAPRYLDIFDQVHRGIKVE